MNRNRHVHMSNGEAAQPVHPPQFTQVEVDANIGWFQGNDGYARSQEKLPLYQYIRLMVSRELAGQIEVLDIGMPILDGWEATHQIKTHRRTAHIPIIVLSGHADADARRRAEDAGADIVLLKPYEPAALTSLVEHLIGARRRN